VLRESTSESANEKFWLAENIMKIAVIRFELFLLTLTLVCGLSSSAKAKTKAFWYNRNHELIRRRLVLFDLRPESLDRVRNVILFVGDGMGLTTVTASRVYKRQKLKNAEAKLEFDEFPASALIHTDAANSQISESAAAATALFSGVKTNFENLGVDESADTPEKACTDVKSHAPSIISWAQERKLKTGSVRRDATRSNVSIFFSPFQVCDDNENHARNTR
jgi:alkaline phosphatase